MEENSFLNLVSDLEGCTISFSCTDNCQKVCENDIRIIISLEELLTCFTLPTVPDVHDRGCVILQPTPTVPDGASTFKRIRTCGYMRRHLSDCPKSLSPELGPTGFAYHSGIS